MYLVDELLSVCQKGSEDKDIFLELNGKKIPMSSQYYIVDEIVFFEVVKKEELPFRLDNNGFIYIMEKECENDDSWGDLYTSPMEHLGSCELRFTKDMEQLIQNTWLDNNYEIENIVNTDTEIIIKLF